jgi:hypothetical protein
MRLQALRHKAARWRQALPDSAEANSHKLKFDLSGLMY